MDTTGSFLAAVLPVAGLKCAAVWYTRPKHFFFNTTDELATFVLQHDAAGQTVYFACASYQTNTSRKGENVAALRCLFSDVDVGEGKPYRTTDEATAALSEFLRATGMPPPAINNSGSGGLHIFWPFDRDLTREQWLPYALALKQLFNQHHFKVDQVRTSDVTSILRPPGTHNRKHGLVRAVSVIAAATMTYDPASLPLRPAPVQRKRTLDVGDIYPETPSDPHKIAAECGQLRLLRDTRGNVPEPIWTRCLGVLKHATNGYTVAHEWSDGHPNYSPDETEEKLERVIGPTKCETFEGINPEPCKICPHRTTVTTPLQLGRTVNANQSNTLAKPEQTMNGARVPEDFINDERGLWFITEDKQGHKNEEKISMVPIRLDRIYRDERTNEKHSLMLTLGRKSGEVSFNISAGELFSPRGMARLHELGAVIHEPDLFRRYVRENMDTHYATQPTATCWEQFGWKNDDAAFLFGARLYTADGVVPIIGSDEIKRRSRLLGPRAGSLAAWSAAANRLFASGCEAQSFAMLCSYGAPLMRFHQADEGGAIVNLISDLSGTGKTTSLELSATVWGELNGLKLTDEDTRVSRGLLLGALGNLPCMFDELHDRDPDSIRQFVIMFTNGRDKLRANMDGTLRLPSGEWQTILVLGSNLSLVDIMQSKNTEEAQAYRVLELVNDFNLDAHDGDKLRRTLRANCGHAGDAYLRYILQPEILAAIKTQLPLVTDALWNETKWDKRHRFWIRTLACAFIAGKIVTSRGWLDFNVNRIIKWAIDACTSRIEEQGIGPRDYALVLNEAFAEMIRQTLYTADEWRPKHTCIVLREPSEGTLAIRGVRETGRLFIRKSVLHKWLLKNAINRATFASDLKQRKVVLHSNKFVTMGAGTDYAYIGQQMCYEVDLHHPALAGILMELEKLIPAKERERRPLAEIIPLRPRLDEGSRPPPSSAR